MCKGFNEAYNLAFTWANITVWFAKCVIWPLSTEWLLPRPLPLSYTDIETVVEVHNLKEMVLRQRRSRRAEVLNRNVVVRAGYLDTRYCCLLTSAEDLAATERIEKKRTSNRHLDNQKRAQKELRDAKKAEARKRSREGQPIAVMTARAARLCVPVGLVREPHSLRLRRAIAKARKSNCLLGLASEST
eukprot:IDg11588t1